MDSFAVHSQHTAYLAHKLLTISAQGEKRIAHGQTRILHLILCSLQNLSNFKESNSSCITEETIIFRVPHPSRSEQSPHPNRSTAMLQRNNSTDDGYNSNWQQARHGTSFVFGGLVGLIVGFFLRQSGHDRGAAERITVLEEEAASR